MSIRGMIDLACHWADDDAFGYSQRIRWLTGPDATSGTMDCASLQYMAAAWGGGYAVQTGWGNTETMLADFTAAGWTAVPFDGNLSDLTPGDIMLNCAEHTEMYIGDGMFVGAHSAENGGIDGEVGDQDGHEISRVPAYIFVDGWDYVLVPPREDGDDDWHIDYQFSTAEEGELPQVADGAEAGVAGHWPNGMRAEIPGAKVTYCPIWLYAGKDFDTYADGDWAKKDGDYLCGFEMNSYFPAADHEVVQQVHVSPDSPGPNAGQGWWPEQVDADTADGMDGYAGEPGDPIDLGKLSIRHI